MPLETSKLYPISWTIHCESATMLHSTALAYAHVMCVVRVYWHISFLSNRYSLMNFFFHWLFMVWFGWNALYHWQLFDQFKDRPVWQCGSSIWSLRFFSGWTLQTQTVLSSLEFYRQGLKFSNLMVWTWSCRLPGIISFKFYDIPFIRLMFFSRRMFIKKGSKANCFEDKLKTWKPTFQLPPNLTLELALYTWGWPDILAF
jgi:hypothetical protein